MNAHIIDQDALKSIPPAALIAYARTEGWSRHERFGKHSDVYVKAAAPELIIPGTGQIADYAAVVSELLQILAAHEGRTETQVFRDLVGSDRDVVRIRAPEADGDGSVSVDDGVNIVLSGRDLLLSAACSANEPRPAYRAGSNRDASAYMTRVRLGQTEQGSFIVTMLAPVPPAPKAPVQADLWPMPRDEPFERLVTRFLADGLEAAHQAAEDWIRGDGMSAFDRAVPKGVSANLCEALSTLIDTGNGLDVSVTWSRTRPAPEARRTVRFARSEGEVFKEAARILRNQEPRPDERLEGYVVTLGRKPEQTEGQITLKTFIDGKPVAVKTTLTPDLYTIALAAHEDRMALKVTGDLRRDGHRWRMENPRDVEAVFEDDSSP